MLANDTHYTNLLQCSKTVAGSQRMTSLKVTALLSLKINISTHKTGYLKQNEANRNSDPKGICNGTLPLTSN